MARPLLPQGEWVFGSMRMPAGHMIILPEVCVFGKQLVRYLQNHLERSSDNKERKEKLRPCNLTVLKDIFEHWLGSQLSHTGR